MSEVSAVAENLALDRELMRTRRRDEILFRHFGVRREGIIERQTRSDSEQSHSDQWSKHAGNAHTGRQHRDNLVRARHSPERKKQRQQERHWQQE